MTFADPLALLLLPLAAALYLLRRPGLSAADAVYLPPAMAAAAVQEARAAAGGRALLPALVVALLVVALAGPRRVETLDVLPASGRDLVLALDLSGSMEREDFDLGGARTSRLAAVKEVAARFVEGRAGDRVGLVVFGDRSYVAAPLTHDVASVARAVEGLTIGVSGRSTAISDGLGLAVRRLLDSEAQSRVVILLSDGVDTTGSVAPVEAAALGASLGMRVHTIALGPEDLETAPAARDAVDVATLRAVAEAGGGEMFRVRSTAELAAVAAAIDALEPSLADAPPVAVWREFWPWPAGAAVALALLALALERRAA